MKLEEKYSKTLKIRIDSELLDHLKNESEELGVDVSSYVRWCLRTGLYLKDLNMFIHSKSGEKK